MALRLRALPHPMPAFSTTLLASAMLLSRSVPARAFACSCAGNGIFAANPKDITSGVPLDVAQVVIGTGDPATIKLADESGAPVAFTLETGPGPLCAPQWMELRPKAPLRSNTRYRISATSPSKTLSQAASRRALCGPK